MKKILSAIVCVIVLIGCIPLSVFASEAITPYYNNVVRQSTLFDIDENGIATVKASYVGQSGVTTGATIKTKIQKRFLLVFWSDVASWTDEATGHYYSNTHSTTVESGYYRAQVEYTIRGTGGDSDVITDELEYSY